MADCISCGKVTAQACRCGTPYCKECAEKELCRDCGEFLVLKKTSIADEKYDVLKELKRRTLMRKAIKELPYDKKIEVFEKIVIPAFKAGFACPYCGRKMGLNGRRDEATAVFSIDHIRSRFWGGASDTDNLQVACQECNLMKGTTMHDTFKELLKSIPTELRTRWYAEAIAGMYAYKRQRNKDEIKTK